MQHRLVSVLRHLRRVVAPRADGALSDAQLLERFAAQRDEAAFEVLVWRHGPMVLNVGRRVLGNLHDGEDVLQATFLALVRQARSIARREALGAWLHKVAYRIALRARIQRRQRTAAPLADVPEPEEIAQKPGYEAIALLDEELQRLPAKYRTPLVLSYLQGMTNQEIASDLGCPIGTVFTRLARGREMLRLRLVRRGVTLSSSLLAGALTQTASAAPLTADLVKPTLRAAMAFAAGTTVVSPHVAALTEGVLKMMWLSKLKLIAALLALTVLAGAGAGILAFRADGQERDHKNPTAINNEKPAPQRRPPREALRYGGKSFDDWHTTLLIDLKPEVRAEAIKALSTFGAHGYGREAATIIVDAVRGYKRVSNLHDDQDVMNAAIAGIRKIGSEAVPVLIAEMKRGKPSASLFAITCLAADFSPDEVKPAIPVMIDALKSKDSAIRQQAVRTLREIDREAKSTQGIAALLSDPDPHVRHDAFEALAKFKAKAAIPQLRAAVTKGETTYDRQLAIAALRAIQPGGAGVVPALKTALKDQSKEVRREAIETLGNLGPEGKDAIPELTALLKSSGDLVERRMVLGTLRNMGTAAKSAVPALMDALKAAREKRSTASEVQEILKTVEIVDK